MLSLMLRKEEILRPEGQGWRRTENMNKACLLTKRRKELCNKRK
jgi:hypothetical protein